jgi:hypothetical protein
MFTKQVDLYRMFAAHCPRDMVPTATGFILARTPTQQEVETITFMITVLIGRKIMRVEQA